MDNNFIPARGMRDFLPHEASIREEIRQKILKKYQEHGFQLIETPALENISFLEKNSENSDNQKLIFKVLKRGKKLSDAINNFKEENEVDKLSDLGLRFDLTVPLTRYYQNNKHLLPKVFKSIQIGNVWRAEKPQRGRYRQFTQCDIDIIGLEDISCELALLKAVTDTLNEILKQKFTIKINSRIILNKLFQSICPEEQTGSEKFFIAIDKKNKIGLEKVLEEIKLSYPSFIEEQFLKWVGNPEISKELKSLINQLKEYTEANKIENCNIIFEPLLCRGMGYYTGTVFEIVADNYPGSISGGGRYDNFIPKTHACGLSIGFERIVEIITENNKS